jgi:hypothetical protein
LSIENYGSSKIKFETLKLEENIKPIICVESGGIHDKIRTILILMDANLLDVK